MIVTRGTEGKPRERFRETEVAGNVVSVAHHVLSLAERGFAHKAKKFRGVRRHREDLPAARFNLVLVPDVFADGRCSREGNPAVVGREEAS